MAIAMIAIWMVFLWILVKIKVLKRWALWMKLSPLAIYLGVMAVLFIPMNFGAPVGGGGESDARCTAFAAAVRRWWIQARAGLDLGELTPTLEPTSAARSSRQRLSSRSLAS